MSEFFLNIVNMSISASWIVLTVILLRVVLKKAPKWINILLWGIVAVRLICPFHFESTISLIPSAQPINPKILLDQAPTIDSGIPIIDGAINPIINASFRPDAAASAHPLQIWIPILSVVWIAGIVILFLYMTISYWRIKRKTETAVKLYDNIYQSESVVSPFVLGILKPKIYLPFHICKRNLEHVIAHEKAHIKRKDYLWKPLGFFLLTVLWFNPLMWLGYILLCRDIELACDEKVIKDLDNKHKADYSEALLACSINRHIITACPLAFGEVSIKERVTSVLNYKKPALWIMVVAIIVSAVVAVCFLTNPKTSLDERAGASPNHLGVYEETPIEQIDAKYDAEEFVITKSHYQSNDGEWVCGDYTYKYRLEITGKRSIDTKSTTYIVLSNTQDITYDQTWKASGFSSLMSDYFEPSKAVIVGHKLFD